MSNKCIKCGFKTNIKNTCACISNTAVTCKRCCIQQFTNFETYKCNVCDKVYSDSSVFNETLKFSFYYRKNVFIYTITIVLLIGMIFNIVDYDIKNKNLEKINTKNKNYITTTCVVNNVFTKTNTTSIMLLGIPDIEKNTFLKKEVACPYNLDFVHVECLSVNESFKCDIVKNSISYDFHRNVSNLYERIVKNRAKESMILMCVCSPLSMVLSLLLTCLALSNYKRSKRLWKETYNNAPLLSTNREQHIESYTIDKVQS